MTVIAFVFQLKSLKSKWRLVSVSGAAEQTCSKYVLRLSSQRSPSRERSTWMNRLRTPLAEWRRWRMWCRSLPRTVRTFWTPWRRPRSRKRCLIILTYQHRFCPKMFTDFRKAICFLGKQSQILKSCCILYFMWLLFDLWNERYLKAIKSVGILYDAESKNGKQCSHRAGIHF